MNTLSKHISLSIITLSFFAIIDTHCMENNNTSDVSHTGQESSAQKTDREKEIKRAIDQLFDKKNGVHAENIISSLKNYDERRVAFLYAAQLSFDSKKTSWPNSDSLMQKKTLQTFLLLDLHPVNDQDRFDNVKQLLAHMFKNISQIDDPDVIKKFIDLQERISLKEKELLENRLYEIRNQEANDNHWLPDCII